MSFFFPTAHSKAVLLLQFLFVCASAVSYVSFVLSLFFPFLLIPQEGCSS